MNTRLQFGKELQKRVTERQDIVQIGRWIFTIFFNWPNSQDKDFLNLLLHLSTMEEGPEFAFTYEELNQIADDLIAGKNVKL
ncbi:MAG: hypothetical protein NTX86_00385 [Candidatus Dependentiae bacterium]|nr:hypothetical protein [Candidatus Dependentiae bacterium]